MPTTSQRVAVAMDEGLDEKTVKRLRIYGYVSIALSTIGAATIAKKTVDGVAKLVRKDR